MFSRESQKGRSESTCLKRGSRWGKKRENKKKLQPEAIFQTRKREKWTKWGGPEGRGDQPLENNVGGGDSIHHPILRTKLPAREREKKKKQREGDP